jgi:poly-gamma-glutamate capsule biosynthesis protein CapA/YwtB (metallophosphatase superfamily)
MSTDHDASEPGSEEPGLEEAGAGVGPQTPAARRRAGLPVPQDPGVELATLEESAAGDVEVHTRPAPPQVSEPSALDEPTAPAEPGPEGVVGPDELGEPDPAAPRGRAPHAPPRQPPPATRPAPASTRERAAALLALGSAVGLLLFLLLSLGSSRPPAGTADFRAEASLRVVAPGGWIVVTGSDAPERIPLLLETRARGEDWRVVDRSTSDDAGRFRLDGRVLAAPGHLTLRARAPGVGTSAPVGVTVRPLRLASVGDINLGDTPGAAIAANGPRYPWTSVGRALRAADIAFGNLECAVSKRGVPFPKQFNFRGTPSALRGLRRASGIDVLNLANNHVGDFGREATLDTVRAVERLGMRAVGAGPNLRRALAPQIVERLGLRVAFVGFSSIAPLEFAAGEDTPGTAWASPASVAAAVHAARRRADVVVATFHWGIEKSAFETAEQRLLAQTAAAAGAHLMIGAHPHVLQPVRREGAALVAYSLGNFVFGAGSSDTTSTGILVADLTADGVGAARWRAGRIVSTRPVLDSKRPKRLPLRDAATMDAGVSL